MPYIAEISRVKPGCFLFLIDQSSSMEDPFGGEAARRKADGVADAINRLLQNLVIKCTKSEGVRDYFEVGVIGYGASVGSAFAGSLSEKRLATITEISSQPARVEERKRKVDDGTGGLVDETVRFPVWLDPISRNGTPMCQALEYAYRIVSDWVGHHDESYPPIVINITDGEGTDGDPTNAADRIKNVGTQDGRGLLFNLHISSLTSPAIVFPDSPAGLPDEFSRMLFQMSSVLPEGIRKSAQSEGYKIGDQARGFAFNAHLVDVIRFLDIGTRPSNTQLR